MRDTKAILILALLCFGLVAAVAPAPAHGGSGDSAFVNGPGALTPAAEGRQPDNQRTAYRTSINSADSSSLSSALLTSVPEFPINGRPTLVVSVRSSVSLAQVGVVVVWLRKPGDGTNTILGISDVRTSTTTLYRDDAGKYMGSDVFFETRGATHCRVLCAGLSAGSCEFWTGS